MIFPARDSAETRDAFRWPYGRSIFRLCVFLGFLAEAGVVGGAFLFLIAGASAVQTYLWIDSVVALIAIEAILRFARNGSLEMAGRVALLGAAMKGFVASALIAQSDHSNPMILAALATLLIAVAVAPLLAIALGIFRETGRRARSG